MPPCHSTRRHCSDHVHSDGNLIALAHPICWDCLLDLAPHSSSSLRSTSSVVSSTLVVDRRIRADAAVAAAAAHGAREVARDAEDNSEASATEAVEEGEVYC